MNTSQLPNTFYLTPEMPLYADMEDIARRKGINDITLYSHEEVWNESVSAKVL